MRKLMVMVGIFLLCFPVLASAQGEGFIQKNDMGFSFFTGAPFFEGGDAQYYRVYGVNFMYHPLPHIAIEPSIFYYSEARDSRNNLTGQISTSDTDELGYGLGIFYYRNLSTNLYMYAGPRFQFSSYDDSDKYADGSRSEYEISSRYIVLTFGLKYMFNDHFGVFGDLGYGFGTEEVDDKRWNSAGTLTDDRTYESDLSSIVNGSVGVTFYFQ